MNEKIKIKILKNLADLLKAAIGAAITAGLIAFFEFIGANFSESISNSGMVAGALTGLKKIKWYV